MKISSHEAIDIPRNRITLSLERQIDRSIIFIEFNNTQSLYFYRTVVATLALYLNRPYSVTHHFRRAADPYSPSRQYSLKFGNIELSGEIVAMHTIITQIVFIACVLVNEFGYSWGYVNCVQSQRSNLQKLLPNKIHVTGSLGSDYGKQLIILVEKEN